MNTIKQSFIVRKSKTKSNGKAPIYLRIEVDGQRKEISTKKDILPSKWSAKRQRAKGNTLEAKSLNANLEQVSRKVLNAETQLLKEDKEITAESLKLELKGNAEPRVQLIEFFEEHLFRMKELIGKDYAENTYKRYNTCLKHLKSFLEKNYKVKSLPIVKVDLSFIVDFEHYLKTKKKPCNHNSSLKYIDHLKKVIKVALDKEIINIDPFKKYSSKYKTTDPIFLNSEELDRLISKRLDIDRVDRVRDVFVFCCYTGIAYADFEKLTINNIDTDKKGEKWISLERKKTGEPASIMLLDIPLAIIEKYRDDPETQDGSLLPVISSQKTNAYLKEIATLCGIKKNLTFHVARHTFATTVTLERGVTMGSLQKMLGHKDIRSTMHYARVTRNKIARDMKKLRSTLSD